MKSKNRVKVGSFSKNAIETSRGRVTVIISLFCIVFCIISIRVLDVSVFSHKKIALNNDSQTLKKEKTVIVRKNRADIIDRNGIILATNLKTASVYANPHMIMNATKAAKKLSKTLPDLSYNRILQRLQSKRKFVWIKRNITPEEQYNVNALGISGVQFMQGETRVYPQNNLLAHTLGFTNIDSKGLSGIEKKFDNYLAGIDSNYDKKPLQLSIDSRAQTIVRDVLLNAVNEFRAIGASAVVMDAQNGEIISMVSVPDFNLNIPSGYSDNERFNRATYGIYEMGSTFKTFNMALGFELGDIGMRDIYDVSKPIKISKFTINDYHQKKSHMTVPEIFMYSSNIGSARIAIDIGADSQKDFLRSLGLLDIVDFELPERGSPLYPDRWGRISAMTISYGHGIAVTPLHIVRATAALVNGGLLPSATLIKRNKEKKSQRKRVVSKKTSDRIRKLMRLAVQYGTGANADAEGYMVGGKTGSADKPKNGRYNTKATISSFIAAFPMNDPKYTVIVLLDEPVGNARTGWYATGGMVAAPAIKEIVSRISPILGVMPVNLNDYKIRKEFWYDNDPENQEVASLQAF